MRLSDFFDDLGHVHAQSSGDLAHSSRQDRLAVVDVQNGLTGNNSVVAKVTLIPALPCKGNVQFGF